MNNADLIVRILKDAGISHGFGIPSGNVLPFMEAMRLGGIEFVLTAHEGTAGFCADVTGRLSGKPGLAIATLGPGATNLATGVGDAWLDRSPMIAITCNLNEKQLGRRLQMLIDHHALFKPITKATLPVRPGNVVKTVQDAIRIALSEPRGPVHLDLPEDVMLAPATEVVPPPAAVPAFDAKASDTAIARALELIAGAKRPVVVIGSSAMRMGNPDLLRRFVEKHNMPFATTTMAKGMIDEDHPLSVGCIERGRRQVQRKFLRSADLIVGLGYDTVEVEFEAWIANVPLLQVDIEPVDVAPSVTVAAEVTGSLDSSLQRLADADPTTNDWTVDAIAAHRNAFQRALRPASNGLTPYQVIDTVREALPRDGILAFDVGAHTHQIASQWTAHAPKSFLITNGWSSMGFGLPAAIAAKIARPDAKVVCIVGDGCFQMTCGELATARRMGLAIPFVVLNDSTLSLIHIKQSQRQFGHSGVALGTGNSGPTPPYYFGVPATGVDGIPALKAALDSAFAADGPTVIETYVDPAHYMETVFD
jgi:acetolactate synthase-1/2/3 large subunit